MKVTVAVNCLLVYSAEMAAIIFTVYEFSTFIAIFYTIIHCIYIYLVYIYIYIYIYIYNIYIYIFLREYYYYLYILVLREV